MVSQVSVIIYLIPKEHTCFQPTGSSFYLKIMLSFNNYANWGFALYQRIHLCKFKGKTSICSHGFRLLH